MGDTAHERGGSGTPLYGGDARPNHLALARLPKAQLSSDTALANAIRRVMLTNSANGSTPKQAQTPIRKWESYRP